MLWVGCGCAFEHGNAVGKCTPRVRVSAERDIGSRLHVERVPLDARSLCALVDGEGGRGFGDGCGRVTCRLPSAGKNVINGWPA